MLQQTQVSRVLEYYRRWLRTFPTWKALAHARTDALIHAWAGLGYNRRALYMREAARQVVEQGEPRILEEWRSLKGVGPYTAAAIYAFSTHKKAIAIDTNIRRVIGRLYLGTPFPNMADDKRVARAMEKSLSARTGWETLYALMDLGSEYCTAHAPRCATCPLRKACRASNKFLNGNPKKPRTISRERIYPGKRFPDRIYRGRILALVRAQKRVRVSTIGPLVDERFSKKDATWILSMLQRLVRDGLLDVHNGVVTISKTS